MGEILIMQIVGDTVFIDPKVSAILQKPKRVTTFLIDSSDTHQYRLRTHRGKSSVVTIVSGVDKPTSDMVQSMSSAVPTCGSIHLPFVSQDETNAYGLKAITKLSAVRTKYAKKASTVMDELQQDTPDSKFFQHIHVFDRVWEQFVSK